MGVALYPYQLEVLDKLQSGSILCGGVGSGKSRTALSYYFLKIGKGQLKINGKGVYEPMKIVKPLYIITTARKRDTYEWEKELIPFMIEDVIIDSWNKISKYKDIKNAFVIFDEQRVIGSGSWVKSFLKIVKNNEWILLTATPGDSWMDYIPVFIANGFYKNRTEFLREHVIFNSYVRYPKVERFVRTRKLHELRRQILIKMKYQKQTASHYKDIYTTFNKEQFEQALTTRWDIFKNEPVKDAAQLVYLLRKIVNADQSRVDSILILLKKHDRLIIFYNFNYELDILRDFALTNKITFAEWNGQKHEPLPQTDVWLYLVQYAAGAEGWNCIETDALVFYSQNYSYRMTIQAAGRIDRVNTPYTDLYYYRLRTNSQIDNAISQVHKAKKDFNELAFVETLDSRQKHAI